MELHLWSIETVLLDIPPYFSMRPPGQTACFNLLISLHYKLLLWIGEINSEEIRFPQQEQSATGQITLFCNMLSRSPCQTAVVGILQRGNFFESSHLALKLAKSANGSKKVFILQTFVIGIIKCKIYCRIRIHWKKCKKKLYPKSYRFKNVAHINKSQKLHFSVTFLLITFFVLAFLQFFSANLKSASNSDTHIAFLKLIKFVDHISTFCKLWCQAQTKRLPKTYFLFHKCVLE